MNIFSHIHKPSPAVIKLWELLLILTMGVFTYAQAQTITGITIGGNVYGGGDKADVKGNTSVQVISGDLQGSVFGGARMANIDGNAFVHIDGETEGQVNYILVNEVFGGNDITGKIGEDKAKAQSTLPTALSDATQDGVDETWDAFVHISNKKVTDQNTGEKSDIKKIYIGNLYAGGNGQYDYDSNESPYKGLTTPNLGKTYLDIHGGSIVYAFGGGNEATVTEKTVICVKNESDVVNHITNAKGEELLTDARFSAMGVSGYQQAGSGQFQIGRLFGGNNQTAMDIRPTWHLDKGSIRNVYSGGNRGNMTYVEGLLLEIHEGSEIVIDNLYGGCRMADVIPLKPGTNTEAEPGEIQLTDKDEHGNDIYKFPAGLAARLLVRGGDVNNVYGGNDITGHVAGGNAVGIYAKVRGNVYGGGNGSYPYTDRDELKDNPVYRDFYYGDTFNKTAGENPSEQQLADDMLASVRAMNNFRPDAEQVSIRLSGTEDKPTIIEGAVFLGGNSATIKSTKDNPRVELKMGSYVIADNIFLGNNGENMVKYNDQVIEGDELLESEGVLKTFKDVEIIGNSTTFNSIDLTDKKLFAEYMEGAAMSLIPTVTFDDDYAPYTSYVGSFYCGGNRGSMTYPGTNTMDMNAPVVVYEKVVGGCHDSYIAETDYNAEYVGGILGSVTERVETDGKTAFQIGNNKNRMVLNFNGIKIEPKRWALETESDDDLAYKKDESGEYIKAYKAGKPYLEWNTVGLDENGKLVPVHFMDRAWASIDKENPTQKEIAAASDAGRRLDGGNIFGGCHESGIVNGNVVININKDLVVRNELFAEDEVDAEQDDLFRIKDGVTPESAGWKSGVILYNQAYDVLSVAMTVFGGGYGENTEIWGSTHVNLNEGFTFQIFGGGYAGIVGKKDSNGDYYYDPAYSTNVSLSGQNAGYSTDVKNGPVLAEAEYLYGAGNEGDVCGDSHVYLGNGRIYDSFGGASDADVLGNAETYIGYADGFPWVRDIIYGGNDFGGTIQGRGRGDYKSKYWSRVSNAAKPMVYGADPNNPSTVPDVIDVPAYVEYTQGWVDTIFGGNYGNYNYYDPDYMDEVVINEETGETEPQVKDMPYVSSTFVNIRPANNENTVNSSINAIFGGSTGHLGDRRGDQAQDRSYVLIDIPAEMDNFSQTEIFGSGSYSGLGMRETVLPMEEVAEVQDPGNGGTQEQQTAYQNYQNYLSYLTKLDNSSAIIDLVSGKVGAAYGGSYNEGITRRTLVNVPNGSTISIGSIFGGAYGNVTLSPCDVYEAHVEYHSSTATLRYNPPRVEWYEGTTKKDRTLGFDPDKINDPDYVNLNTGKGEYLTGNILEKGAIYGGNNYRRRTLYGKVNIDVILNQQSYKYGSTTGYIYGAGCGERTWSEYTEVNLLDGAQVWEVYGGGQNGLVINAPSIQKYINEYASVQGLNIVEVADPEEGATEQEKAAIEAQQAAVTKNLEQWQTSWTIGSGYDGNGISDAFSSVSGLGQSTFYVNNPYTNLDNPLVTPRTEFGGKKFSTNVIVNRGAYVGNYAYGGGLGSSEEGMEGSGDVYGTTYFGLLGGTVNKDIYAAGTTGGVYDAFGVTAAGANGFTASATAYIQGGSARNVYGGGWEGNVGKAGNTVANDIPGEANVIIGIRPEYENNLDFYYGVPAIQRNAYGGGEGGSVIGAANITVNNGYIGYAYLAAGTNFGEEGKVVEDNTKLTAWYAEKIDDETYRENGEWKGVERLKDCGNVFGSGYDDMSAVDVANVILYGGTIRNSVFGGGEIATVGRGTNNNGTISISKAGKTHITMYNGSVLRNVFGAGKGYNSLGYGGSHNLHTDGYVFGQTDVNIHGGIIGTVEGITNGDGNVFGGGDRGFVYSAYEYLDADNQSKQAIGKKSETDEGYYYKYENGSFKTDNGEKIMTEDCHVLVEPWLQVTADNGIDYDNNHYAKWDYVPTAYLNTLPAKPVNGSWDSKWNDIDVGSVSVTLGNNNEVVNRTEIERGVIIYNAVFAGGNVSSSGDMNAHANTVFGNATATIHDVYNRDFVTIGTGRTGGLYGDGNLTFVDGYRELNITNYGTDFYHINENIQIDAYRQLPTREQSYYELKYKCIKECTDNDGTTYTVGSTIPQEQLYALFIGITYTDDQNEVHDMIGNDGKPSSIYWVENGVLLRAPGRTMNTVQRADFCGVFGSRMVMQGARDRVPETADLTNYTINRVREVSLNKKVTIAPNTGDNDTDTKNAQHGNYFGIYSVVNYLGALTSDVDFGDENANADNDDDGILDYAKRTSDNTNTVKYHADISYNNSTIHYDDKNYTFYNWKKHYQKTDKRITNNGNSYNQVALASGVYLELTTEKSTGDDLWTKDWGYVTGVIELDLINVATGVGGGFVYAKNEHGKRSATGLKRITLTELNRKAVSNKKWSYATADAEKVEWQTSGNFVHSGQTIIDDCYNISGKYLQKDGVPAHYWYIKGQIYVYDQIISAYTGVPNAYSEKTNIPLTISAGANGKMTLLDVKPSKYAYYSSFTNETGNPLSADGKLVINDVTYNLNDPISYWDWYNLSKTEQKLFVDETYLTIAACTVGSGNEAETIPSGKVMLPAEYERLCSLAVEKDITPDDGISNLVKTVVVNGEDVGFDYVFRSSNNVSHNTGYILTYRVTNPEQWDTWFTPKSGSASTDKIDSLTYKNGIGAGTIVASNYHDGPTYTPTVSDLYGQRLYSSADIITEEEYNDYNTEWNSYTQSNTWSDLTQSQQTEKQNSQAQFERAWITTDYVNTGSKLLQTGAKLAKSEFCESSDPAVNDWPAAFSGKVAQAFVCSSTIKLSQTEYITKGDLITESQKNAYITAINNQISELQTEQQNDNSIDNSAKITSLQAIITDINSFIVPAYYNASKVEKYYGGKFYESGHNYRALDAWSSMPTADHSNFTFNYDALDLLIDPTYAHQEGKKYQYDSRTGTKEAAQSNKAHYSLATPVDYTAEYYGIDDLYYTPEGGGSQVNAKDAAHKELSRTEFENLLNEQGHYAPINVATPGTYYVVNTAFTHNEPFAVGEVITKDQYDKLTHTDQDPGEQANVTALTFSTAGTYYYCREEYEINGSEGKPVTTLFSVGNYTDGATISSGIVPKGFVIAQGADENTLGCYKSLPNKQLNFTIHGKAPIETSTLYVARGSDIYNLSKEKIITVMYQYDYTESDESGLNITPISERHIVNIHLQFKSGIPTVGDISNPDIVLPGNGLYLKAPSVTPGAYEIIGEGWEIFEEPSYAESHTNGVEYNPTTDNLYWYQDGYQIAYYTKTYLGKTYSKHKPITVANYHDLKKVMDDQQYHLHVDYDHTKLNRPAKIYINNYSDGKDGIDLLKDFFDLSVLSQKTTAQGGPNSNGLFESGTFKDHAKLSNEVYGGANLEFILRTNISHTGEWSSIGSNSGDPCFDGTLHGDGYTINGLKNSLFAKLCGEVYNLGVTGSFSGAGIADLDDGDGGYVENCWIMTTGTPNSNLYAVFGNPASTTDYRKQLVNSYYPNTLGYKTDEPDTEAGKRGIATPMPTESFYNGEVAYDLNSFYLNKRYYDGHGKDTDKSADYYTSYKYIDPTVNAPNKEQYSVGYYPAPEQVNDYAQYGDLGYVEERYNDGDFRYADGTIPTSVDARYIEYNETQEINNQTITEHKTGYAPIWPDDYVFFGQTLSFGYDDRTHNDVPSHYNGSTNRVYRAPAYYGNNTMSVAHFNPDAVLPNKSYDGTRDAYPGMTALDLTGGNGDVSTVVANRKNDFSQGVQQATGKFYAPLLDYSSLTSFRNDGQTQNMLVYVNSADETTTTLINTYFKEPEYNKYTNVLDDEGVPTERLNDDYGSIRKVSVADSTAVRGHLVIYDGTDYYAANDQFLVDKQDFNAPIGYNMEKSDGQGQYVTAYMWYQRQPDVYVKDNNTGWESVSLPFTADKVTTSQKGVITHFYQGASSDDSHEYWLRTPDRIDSQDASKILFQAIGSGTGTDISTTTRNTTFLWDYYYSNINSGSGANRHDANGDTYQEYYSEAKTFNPYPLASKAQPYLIGFPSDRYYEFDLSGKFEAQNTAATGPVKLGKQTITFISGSSNVTINVTDEDYETATSVTDGNYVFKPTYQKQQLSGQNTWLLTRTGTAFEKDNEAATVTTVPFRAYIAGTASAAPQRAGTRAGNDPAPSTLYIGYAGSQDQLAERKADGGLLFYGQDMNICIESTLDYEAQITIYTSAGKLLKQFTIQPGTKATVPVNNRGIYIVNRHKVAVTK